ncbi:hypothetical protein ACFO0S_10775 [Chryseomicrobium palamuruense]|uniref:Peptidase M48 domain-containing protein n=1 Tax=Chryseomicrobium palamuruense TaxID=682973 RepID=A0ABV8UW63_9BACL
MKGFLKFLLFLVVMVLFLGGSGYLIFSYDELIGMLWGIVLWFVPFAIFIISLVALVVGKLPRLGIRSRWSGTVVLVTSLAAGLAIVLLAFGNAFVIQAGNVDESVKEKVRWYARLTGQTTMQDDSYRVDGKYATYYVTEDNEHKVAIMEELFPRMEAQLDRYLSPLAEGEKPEIELHRNASTLQLLEMDGNMAGVYSIITGRIDMLENTPYWEKIFIHEYTHYRVHQFQLQEAGKHVRIPHWLEEGFAEAMTGSLMLGPFDNYKNLSFADASSKILQMNNHTQDVYTYGQILTSELIHGASTEQFQKWLLTDDYAVIEEEIRDLYQIPEDVTTQSFLIDRYEETLAKDRTYFDRTYEIPASEWEEEWDAFQEEVYFPMYGQYLSSLRRLVLGELDFDAGEKILQERLSYDLSYSPEASNYDRAIIVAGRGDLDGAIAILEDSMNGEIELKSLETEHLHSTLELLREDPSHPEAIERLEKRGLYFQGTDEWLESLQTN